MRFLKTITVLSMLLPGMANISAIGLSIQKDGMTSVKSQQMQLSVESFVEGCTSELVNSNCRRNTCVLEKTMRSDSSDARCLLTERYEKLPEGIRCKITLTGTGSEDWSLPIATKVKITSASPSSLKYWTAWGSPNIDTLSLNAEMRHLLREYKGGCDAAKGWAVLGGEHNNRWVDPLIPVPFTDSKYFYGATQFLAEDPMTGFVPAQNDLFAIPMAVVIDENVRQGASVILSPKDNILDLELETGKDGTITFRRISNRIKSGKEISFTFDIVFHAPDWRPGIAIAAESHPAYFYPKHENAINICGTGSYSAAQEIKDTDILRNMAFGVNWQASFDFPYMGMFIPPVGKDERWETFGYTSKVTKHQWQTINEMNKVPKEFKDNGFYSLAYFNVCEFGTGIATPRPKTFAYPPSESWKDPNQYLYQNLSNAILPIPRSVLPDTVSHTVPYGTWGGAVVMDCGDDAYRRFLLEQAQKHLTYLPDSYGLCIDRLDWLRMYNERADDGISWFQGKPARSLYTSWKSLMSELGPMMHEAGKVIYVNNHSRRIDLLDEVDGIFDEFTYMGNSMNLMALLCFYKPAMGWVDIAKTIENEGGDPFMQRHLYMGIFPMCPFEGNDHSIRPDGKVEQFYLDYGQMFEAMKGRRWVLTPNVVKVVDDFARVNIFEVDGGYILPAVLGEQDKCVIELNGIKLGSCVEILYPGGEIQTGELKRMDGTKYQLEVPLKKNCALVKISDK